MRVEVGVTGFASLAQELEGDIAKAATRAMRETTPDTKSELRAQITSAGLGLRLANTWRDRVYPTGRQSVTPAGYIWSNAPDIIDSFVRGATIVPVHGSRYLAIPTKNVPQQRGRGARKAMTPFEVEIEFNQDLFFKRGRNGHLLAFVNAVASRSGKSIRQGTKGRLAQGRALKPILMFVLVPNVRLPKLLDLDGPAQRWTYRFETAFNQNLVAS